MEKAVKTFRTIKPQFEPFYDDDDNELPDLEEDTSKEKLSWPSNSKIRAPVVPSGRNGKSCCCDSTAGSTLLMCTNCRLYSGVSNIDCTSPPPAKIQRKDRHFLDSLVGIQKRASTDSESLESLELYKGDGSINIGHLQMTLRSPCLGNQIGKACNMDGYDSDCSLPSVQLYPVSRRSSFSSLESVELYQEMPKRPPPVLPNTTVADLDRQDTDTKTEDTVVKMEIEESPGKVKGRVVRARTRNHSRHFLELCDQDSRSITRKVIHRPSVFPVPPHPSMMFGPKNQERIFSVVKFSEARVNTIEAIMEEAAFSNKYISTVASLIHDFCTAVQEPTDQIIQYLLRDVLMESWDLSRSYNAYHILKYIQSIHPPLGTIPFEWEDIEQAVENLRLPYGLQNANNSAASNALALEVMVSYIEAELLQRSLASEQRMIRSIAYRWLSAQMSYNKVFKVIQWIQQVLIFGEFEEMTESYLKLNLSIGDAVDKPVPKEMPKILPILQRLLDLSITVSRRPPECARRIAGDLLRVRCRFLS